MKRGIQASAGSRTSGIGAKFNRDFLYGLIAFGLSGVIGVLLNIVIVQFYGAAALGIFNQAFVIYLLFSQLAVGGIHLSVQKYIPQFPARRTHARDIMTSALLVVFCLSGAVTILAFLLRGVIAGALASSEVYIALTCCIPGIVFFSLNKVLLSYFNGIRSMGLFALFNGARFVLMLLWFAVLLWIGVHVAQLSLLLFLSELCVFAALASLSMTRFRLSLSKRARLWSRKHVRFGMRAVLGNLLLDVNSKVDIFLLGVFTSDAAVGVYSFAATIAEGFSQLAVVLRANVNPIITRAYFRKGSKVLRRVLRKVIRRSYLAMVPTGCLAILIYPVFLGVLGFADDLQGSWLVFGLLVAGIMASGGYLPVQTIFGQTGFPGYQTTLLALVFLTNATLNLILIPDYGIVGAAVATGLAFIAQVAYLKCMCKAILRIRL